MQRHCDEYEKTLLMITGTLLCVSCTTRPPLQTPDLSEEPANNRPVVPVTFVLLQTILLLHALITLHKCEKKSAS